MGGALRFYRAAAPAYAIRWVLRALVLAAFIGPAINFLVGQFWRADSVPGCGGEANAHPISVARDYSYWRHLRSCTDTPAQISTTAMVAMPPPATLQTGPNHAAVHPDSTAPNWFDELMNMLLKASTRPRT